MIQLLFAMTKVTTLTTIAKRIMRMRMIGKMVLFKTNDCDDHGNPNKQLQTIEDLQYIGAAN